MPVKINGLPAHILLIHVVIVLLPLAALMLSAAAIWPAARHKLGFLTPAMALVALIFVPITIHAGTWLEERVPLSSQLRKHAALGHGVLPWAIALFVVSAAVWVLGRRYQLSWRPSAEAARDEAPSGSGGGTATLTKPAAKTHVLPVWVTVIVAAAAIAVSVGSVIQLVRTGDAGSRTVYPHTVDLPPHPIN